MERCVLRSLLLLGLVVSLTACAGTAYKALTRVDVEVDGFTHHYDESYFAIGDKGVFSVELVTTPDRMKVGNTRFQLILHHVVEGDTENAEVTMIATHKQSGEQITPKIWEDQYGLYDVVGFALKKPGSWDVTILLAKDELTDSVSFTFPGVEN